jgi:lysophospholipase L1-like esterase
MRHVVFVSTVIVLLATAFAGAKGPFTPALSAKCKAYWSPVDWEGGNSACKDQIHGVAIIPRGSTGPAKVANAFGANPGIRTTRAVFPKTPSSFSLPNQWTDVTAVFALVRSNEVITPTRAFSGAPLIGTSYMAGDAFTVMTSFTGGVDSSAWANYTNGNNQGNTINHGPFYLTHYVNGVKVGAVVNRRTSPQVIGSIVTPGDLQSATMSSLFATFGYGCSDDTWGPVAVFNAALTNDDVAEIQTVMQNYGRFTPAPLQREVLFFGDSLTENLVACQCTDANHTWPGMVVRSIGLSTLDWANLGFFGAITSQLNDIASNIGTESLAAPRPAKTCVVWIGTNEVSVQSPAPIIAADIQALCATLRTAGATRIVLVTCIPRNFGPNQAACDDIRAALNKLIVGMIPASTDAVIDLATDRAFNTNNAWSNTSIYTKEGIHLTQKGLNVVASKFSGDNLFPATNAH